MISFRVLAQIHAYIEHCTSNIKHFLTDGCIRVSLCCYLDHSRLRHDASTGRRRRNAANRLAPSHLLGARHLDREPLPVLVVAWWIFYRWRNQQPWTFFLFVFVLLSPTILYLASLLLFPREGDVDLGIEYKTHYYANHRAFFILFALFTPVDIVDSLLKGIPHFFGLGPQYFVSTLLYFAGLTTAAIIRNERYHQVYAIFFLVQTVIISFAIFHTLV
jgi:hypothetical protein